MFGLLVFVHISLMFSAVAISYGPTLFFLIALRTGRTEAVRAVTIAARPTVRLIPIVYTVAGIFGLLAAINVGFNLLAPWLVIAYVLFVVLTLLGAIVAGPTIERVGAMVATAPDGPLPAGVSTTVGSRFLVIEFFDFALLFVLILDMVVKPFS